MRHLSLIIPKKSSDNKVFKNHTIKAFTLAEVLIVLAIIGVVASLTIPALMNNIQDQQYKTAYKKAFSVASQAWQQCLTDNEIVYRSSWNNDNTAFNTNFLAFKSKFKVAVDCTDGNTFKCWVDNPKERYFHTPLNGAYAFIDNSGMAWSRPGDSNGLGDVILLDTNGNKAPNQFGKDRFAIVPKVQNDEMAAGIPTKLKVITDVINPNTDSCPSGGCYYTSWLEQ